MSEIIYQKLMKVLETQESGKLHYNKGEEDITTGYGIYRKAFPNAKIFKYIDEVAASLGITSPSKTWDKSTVEKVEKAIDKSKELELSEEFYKTEYFKKIDLSKFTIRFAIGFASLYINGSKLASKAVQRTYNVLRGNQLKKPLTEDGILGSKSLESIYSLADDMSYAVDDDVADRLLFEAFISSAKSFYVEMATDNGRDDKQLPFLKGWVLNRCDSLIRDIENIVS